MSKNLYSILCVCMTFYSVIAQVDTVKVNDNKNLNKQIVIVTEYEPSVSDVVRLNTLPKIIDTVEVKPNFKYSVISKPINSNYSPRIINPAKMKQDPLTRLYRTVAKIGYGNYFSALGNIKINSLRSRKSVYGLELNHFSSLSKIKFFDNVKLPAAYSNNGLVFSGKRFVNDLSLYGGIDISRDVFHRYGYDGNNFINYNKDSIRERYFKTGALIGLTNMPDTSKLFFNTSANFNFLQDIKQNEENNIGFDVELGKKMSDLEYFIDVSTQYFTGNVISENVLLQVVPKFKYYVSKFKILAEIRNNYISKKQKYFFHPHIDVSYDIIDNIIVPYFIYSGFVKDNNLSEIIEENPYFNPTIEIVPTNYKAIFQGGMKGSFGKNIPFNVFVKYAIVKDMYFFVNSTSGINYFSVLYDNASLTTIHAESGILSKESKSLNLKADYNIYKMENLPFPYHKPNFQVSLNGRYSMRNKIILNTDIFLCGQRHALNYSNNSQTNISLKSFIDANLALEYRYTKVFSFFLNLNNITSGKYHVWNYYPVRAFSVLAGISYSF